MKYLLPLLAASFLSGQTADPWKGLEFLTGEWVGESSQSSGACSFAFDLQRKVLIRKSYAESSGSRHEDLLVIYFEKGLKAIYFDNEDHIIHYTLESSAGSVRFLNEQYRLTYRKDGEKLVMDFDIAPPGKPFSNYLHAALRKK
jgi:hypothetical protein